MNINDAKKIFVLGLAKSGRAVSLLLARHGFAVRVWDDTADARNGFPPPAGSTHATGDLEIVTQAVCERVLDDCDCLVVSPGVPLDHPLVRRAMSRSIDVMGELEVAFQFSKARVIAVTGTNGKSTVTDLIGAILGSAGVPSVVAGNIGTPFSSVLLEGHVEDTVVLEVSSFQLDTIDRFRADIAILLNITPDHLDRYGDSFDRYAASKHRILNRSDGGSFFVYNAEDALCSSFADGFPGTAMPFSSARTLGTGTFSRGDTLVRAMGGRETIIIHRKDFMPAGIHNLENALAAIAAVSPLDIPQDALERALKQYRPLPHRMELVQVAGGVAYINDSKATNIDAAAKSLQSIADGVIVILGGRDKNGDFTTLIPFLGRVKAAVLIGEAAEKIDSAIGGSCRVIHASTMEDAVQLARSTAVAGDTVLLAPACASFDMFANYKERGDEFKRCVKSIMV